MRRPFRDLMNSSAKLMTSSKRPVRDTLEDLTDKVPSGPRGNVGEGTLVGLGGLILVESGEIISLPVPGLNRPGFRKVSHGMEYVGEHVQEHEIVIHAVSEDVAEFKSRYDAAPSNIDFLRGVAELKEVEEVDTVQPYSTYRITVTVDRSPYLEDE